MRNLKALLMGSVAFACVGVASESAQAQNWAFGAGATFPQIVYRQLWDCLYTQVPGGPAPLPVAGALNPVCVAHGGANQSAEGGEMFYAATGSGNGKATLLANSPSAIGIPSNAPPYTDPSIGVYGTANYDGVQFAGSDDIVNAQDVANWTAQGNFAKFGNLIQLPSVVGAVGIGFNGKDGNGNPLNILPAIPTNGSSGLNLSRQALCGIVSGHITQWNNPILTALNGGTLGTGQITFVHRQDGSGTNFLLTNGLATQCQFQFGPNNENDTTVVSYAFPWTNHAGTCPYPVAQGTNQSNWPDQFPTDQCGNTVTYPAGAHYINASGSGSLVALVASTNGAIGYASADFWLPVKAGGLPAANIQSQWDITASTGLFEPPTWQGAQTAMSSATPVFDDTTRSLPLAWSLQGVVPNPSVPGAYPLAGFTWIELYQCYKVHSNGNNPLWWVEQALNFDYAADQVAWPIMESNGFAPVPDNWQNEIYKLLSSATDGPTFAGTGSCANVSQGAY